MLTGRNGASVKSGYPPKAVSLHSVPGSSLVVEPPLSINRGKQLLVARKAASGGPPSRPVASAPALARPTPAASSASSSASQRPLFAADNAADFSFVPKPITTTERAARAANESDAMSVRRSRGGNKVQDGEVHVEVDGSWLVLKVVPDDNSWYIFHSFGHRLIQQQLITPLCAAACSTLSDTSSSKRLDQKLPEGCGKVRARPLRQCFTATYALLFSTVVADVIQQDHETYPDVVLACVLALLLSG